MSHISDSPCLNTKLSLGSHILDFKLGRLIGEGSFSKVRLGWHVKTGKRVAIKIIDKKLTAIKIAKSIHRKKKYLEDEGILPSPTLSLETTLSNSIPSYPSCSWVNIISPISTPLNLFGTNTVDILLSEVKLMMRLNHPNIIKLYQVIDTEAECFIIMDYAAGGEFVDYLASKGRLTEAEARHYFRQLVSAVHHCHSANLVHRDLKLENLLLTHHQELLLSDFGLGRTFYKKEDLMYTFCGTPSYAAIELIQHRPYCGMPADVWSMGVILFVMCSGSMPFFGTTLSSLYKRILGLDYQCPSYFSEDLISLFSRIFVSDPTQRITVVEFLHDLWVSPPTSPNIELYPPYCSSLMDQGMTQIQNIHRELDLTVFTFSSYASSSFSSSATADTVTPTLIMTTSHVNPLRPPSPTRASIHLMTSRPSSPTTTTAISSSSSSSSSLIFSPSPSASVSPHFTSVSPYLRVCPYNPTNSIKLSNLSLIQEVHEKLQAYDPECVFFKTEFPCNTKSLVLHYVLYQFHGERIPWKNLRVEMELVRWLVRGPLDCVHLSIGMKWRRVSEDHQDLFRAFFLKVKTWVEHIGKGEGKKLGE